MQSRGQVLSTCHCVARHMYLGGAGARDGYLAPTQTPRPRRVSQVREGQPVTGKGPPPDGRRGCIPSCDIYEVPWSLHE